MGGVEGERVKFCKINKHIIFNLAKICIGSGATYKYYYSLMPLVLCKVSFSNQRLYCIVPQSLNICSC